MKNKRGQFYLIATILVGGILIVLASVTNYSFKENSFDLEKYGEELKIESEKVLDYETKNSQDKIKNFTKLYSDYLGINVDSYFILEDLESLEAYTYKSGQEIDLSSYASSDGEIIIFNVSEIAYEFEINPGKNFYFILIEEKGSERFVIRN